MFPVANQPAANHVPPGERLGVGHEARCTDLLVGVGVQQQGAQGAQGAGQIIAQGAQGQPAPVINAMLHGGNGAHVCRIFCARTYESLLAKEQKSDGRDS